eukprot:scaffold26962_cov48-Attheya_sp.AAC.8
MTFAIDGAATMVVDAEASAVWEAVVDIDSSPQFISPVVSVERIGGSRKGDPLVAGTKWIEVRQYKKETIIQTKTITTVSSNDSAYPRTFSVNVGYGDVHNNLTNTSTITVSPAHTSKDDGSTGTELSDQFEKVRETRFEVSCKILARKLREEYQCPTETITAHYQTAKNN